MNHDAFIFDMDGTLWDAVDGYCDVWNATIEDFGLDCPRIDRDRLFTQMGKPLDAIMDALIPGDYDRGEFMRRMAVFEAEIVPRRGGVLYPRVREVLEELRRRGARICLVSNCGASGLRNFFDFTGLGELFDDSAAHGINGLSKADNIALVVRRNAFRTPVYVGDTQLDIDSAHEAGIPAVHAAYGFGSAEGADASIDSFDRLLEL
ncbi:MAG: HAD family hydrolase [Muribaculaceae bacterium]|nr:HAD family hydrolase [Muribaculaceae bacterium]MDE6540710.1 HAD family hydrolase [Muribaculaceae bacterium]